MVTKRGEKQHLLQKTFYGVWCCHVYRPGSEYNLPGYSFLKSFDNSIFDPMMKEYTQGSVVFGRREFMILSIGLQGQNLKLDITKRIGFALPQMKNG